MHHGSVSMLSARSSLGPRGLDGGSIAGAVVGAVVGALLIVLCVVPFVLRARRLSRARHGDAALHPELGDAPGGRSPSPHINESKRLSGDLLVPGAYSPSSQPGLPNGHHPKPANGHSPHPSLTHPGVANIHQGPPSPISPLSPTSRPSFPSAQGQTPDYGQAYPTPPADEPAAPTTHQPSVGTVGRESTREPTRTDSHATSSRELAGGITAQGITEEPETFETSSPSPSHRYFTHHIFRKLTEKRHSDNLRRDSRRSTTDGARSPSVSTTDALSQQEPIQPAFEEVDINVRGEAWSYFHDPNLISDPPGSYPPVTAAARVAPPLALVPPAHGQAPLSPVSLPDQNLPGDAAPQHILVKPVVDEPDLISPDGDKTITPLRSFSKQTPLHRGPGSLTRTDSLPPLQPIVADIETGQIPFSASPSARPMDMMRPTNEAESAWRVNQEILKIESPPAELPLQYMEPVDENPYIKSNPSPESDYQSPPDIILTSQDFSEVDFSNMIVDVDVDVEEQMVHYSYFTPPPSSGPSNQNTPDTRISDYTASPSPRSDIGQGSSGQMDSSPRLFPCDQCRRVFDQVHKLNHHKRYHDRPHECTHPGCTMRFGTKTHLDRHVNDKHNKTRKFYCTQHGCPYSRQGGKSFPRKDNWRRHMVNKHQITPDTDPIEYNEEMMFGP